MPQPVPPPIRTVALAESLAAFLQTALERGAEVPADIAVASVQWFDQTIGRAIDTDPSIWAGRPRTYAIAQVKRVAGFAASDALMNPDKKITATILDAAIALVIREQRPLCQASQKGKFGMLGPFCMEVDV